MVRRPSFPGQEGAVAQRVQQEMTLLGFDEVSVDELGSVLGLKRGKFPGPTILLDGHMDVVQVPSPEMWQFPPFGGVISEGRLWGRGACDTKGSLAAMVYAAGTIPTDTLVGNVLVAASVCEETITGAAIRLITQQYPVDVLITGEPTNLRLGIAQKGRSTLQLKAVGRSAHTAQPEQGDNAIYKLMDAVAKIRAIPRMTDPIMGNNVIELTEIISLPYPNISLVPEGCTAQFVCRLLPGETRESLLARYRTVLTDPGLSLQISPFEQTCYTGVYRVEENFLPGWRIPPEEPWLGRILQAIQTSGIEPETFSAPYGTNASAGYEAGIPSFILGPGSIEQAHIVDEWINIREIEKGIDVYQSILRSNPV